MYSVWKHFQSSQLGELLPSSSRWRAEVLLSSLQCKNSCPQYRIKWPQMLIVPRGREPVSGWKLQVNGDPLWIFSQFCPDSHQMKGSMCWPDKQKKGYINRCHWLSTSLKSKRTNRLFFLFASDFFLAIVVSNTWLSMKQKPNAYLLNE